LPKRVSQFLLVSAPFSAFGPISPFLPAGIGLCGPGQLLFLPSFLILFLFIMSDILKSTATAAYRDLTADQFAAGIRQSGTVLVDVRRFDEFGAGHLPGALNIDVTSLDFARRVATLNPNRPTYVYCRSGARSAKAAAQLSAAGFGQVHNLAGGILDWANPLVR
jgi:rhodanese-related sulfurtransferase